MIEYIYYATEVISGDANCDQVNFILTFELTFFVDMFPYDDSEIIIVSARLSVLRTPIKEITQASSISVLQ